MALHKNYFTLSIQEWPFLFANLENWVRHLLIKVLLNRHCMHFFKFI